MNKEELEKHINDTYNLGMLLGIAKDLKKKMYITRMQAKHYCPTARCTTIEEFGMISYEIKHGKLQEFFRQNNVTVIYLDPHANNTIGPLGFIESTTVIVKCIIAR